jgi:hypothetical protein
MFLKTVIGSDALPQVVESGSTKAMDFELSTMRPTLGRMLTRFSRLSRGCIKAFSTGRSIRF